MEDHDDSIENYNKKMKQIAEKDKLSLFQRQTCYREVFNPETLAGMAVMIDLAKFCRANESTFHPDPRAHAQLEGRREVWLRIQQHLNLDSKLMWELYSGRK